MAPRLIDRSQGPGVGSFNLQVLVADVVVVVLFSFMVLYCWLNSRMNIRGWGRIVEWSEKSLRLNPVAERRV